MTITLSKQLVTLRKLRGNTQEELATHLGITVQAVSKWERAEGFPDITLLPAIAAYYDVTVDDLLGVGESEKRRKKEIYNEQEKILFQQGKTDERIKLWRKATQEFPNDPETLNGLMYALLAENRPENAEEIIACGERILDESTDHALRNNALQCLCMAYRDAGNLKKAKEYAGMAGNYWNTKNEIMHILLDGEDAIKLCQSNIQELFDLIYMNARSLIYRGKLKPQEEMTVRHFISDCFHLLYPDGNYGFYHCRIAENDQYLAESYRKTGDVDQMFQYLDEAADAAIRYDTQEDGRYTAPMVDRLAFSREDAVKDYTENESGLLLKKLNGDAYVRFHTDSRMIAIIEKLKSVAVL